MAASLPDAGMISEYLFSQYEKSELVPIQDAL